MPIAAIIQLLIALPSVIKGIMDIIAMIKRMRDGKDKDEASREFEDIKQTIVARRGLGRAERDRIRNLRERLKQCTGEDCDANL